MDLLFSGNNAEGSGGAVFVSGAGIGPSFVNTSRHFRQTLLTSEALCTLRARGLQSILKISPGVVPDDLRQVYVHRKRGECNGRGDRKRGRC